MGKGIVKLGEGQWAVKDGNLLAAKETNGRFKNAEFTVARGTDATYVGRDGLIKRFSSGLANEVANGDFELGDNGDWTLPSGWSISNNQLVGNDPSGFATVANVFYANKSYRLDVDVAERDSGSFSIISNSTDSNSNATPAIDSAGIHTFYFHIGTISLATLYVTFGGDFVGKINSITVRDIENFDDRPRIDFTDNTDGHLLLEPESRNLITYSENFKDGYSTTESSVDLNDAVSPDGTTTANKFNSTATGSSIYKAHANSSALFHTVSIFLKKGTIDIVTLSVTGGSPAISASTTVNLTSGTITASSGNGSITPTITNYGNDWYRITASSTSNGNVANPTISIVNSSTTASGYFYMWGLQFEGLSYATSYIPTSGSTVTRDAETCTGAGEAADFNSEEGVLYAEIAALADDGENNRNIRLISSVDNTTYVVLKYGDPSNRLEYQYRTTGHSMQAQFFEDLVDVASFVKVAATWKSNEFKLFINGEQVGVTETSGNVSPASTFNVLEFQGFHGKVKALRVYKETDGIDLGTLTSL